MRNDYVTDIKCQAMIQSTELCFWNDATVARSIRDKNKLVKYNNQRRNHAEFVAISRLSLRATYTDISIRTNVRFTTHNVKVIILLNPRITIHTMLINIINNTID